MKKSVSARIGLSLLATTGVAVLIAQIGHAADLPYKLPADNTVCFRSAESVKDVNSSGMFVDIPDMALLCQNQADEIQNSCLNLQRVALKSVVDDGSLAEIVPPEWKVCQTAIRMIDDRPNAIEELRTSRPPIASTLPGGALVATGRIESNTIVVTPFVDASGHCSYADADNLRALFHHWRDENDQVFGSTQDIHSKVGNGGCGSATGDCANSTPVPIFVN